MSLNVYVVTLYGFLGSEAVGWGSKKGSDVLNFHIFRHPDLLY